MLPNRSSERLNQPRPVVQRLGKDAGLFAGRPCRRAAGAGQQVQTVFDLLRGLSRHSSIAPPTSAATPKNARDRHQHGTHGLILQHDPLAEARWKAGERPPPPAGT